MTDTPTLARPPIPPLTTQQSGTGTSRAEPASDSEARARQQANDFEATFIASLLQPVFEGLARDSTFGGGFAEETWTSLLTQEYAKGITGKANLGIADHVYNQLIKLQETTSPDKTAPLDNGASGKE